jgi:hypothetical protein
MAKRVRLSQYVHNILAYNPIIHNHGHLEALVSPPSSLSVALRFRLPHFKGSGDGVLLGRRKLHRTNQNLKNMLYYLYNNICLGQTTRQQGPI